MFSCSTAGFSRPSRSTCYTADDVWLSIALPQWLKGLPWLAALIMVQIERKSGPQNICYLNEGKVLLLSIALLPTPICLSEVKERSWAVVQYHHYSGQVHIQPWLKQTVLKAWIFCHFLSYSETLHREAQQRTNSLPLKCRFGWCSWISTAFH